MAHLSLKRTFQRDTAFENVSRRARHDSQRQSSSQSDSSFMKVGRYGLTFKSFFMWSRIVDRGTPSSDDRFRVDFNGERSMEAATAAHVSKRVVFLPLCDLFLTLPRANACFPQSSNIALRGGAWLNRFRNAAITWEGHGLSRVLSLMHPHTCHQVLLDRVTACVSHTENTTKFCGYGKSRVHYLGQCCQTTILHCTACCAVLCKLKLSLSCVLSGCTVTSRPPCTSSIQS